MSSKKDMTNPLLVGTAIRKQLEHEIPQDLPFDREFRENSDYTITDHVEQLHEQLCKDPRRLELVNGLVRHLHAFLREKLITHDEWKRLIEFLTRAGKESTEFKNEFILLSDCFGASALVDELNHPKPLGCTDSCEPGPFYTEDAPEVRSGVSLAKPDTTGEAMFFSGSIVNTKGHGVKGAKVDVWQADGDGIYDVQYPGREEPNDRGKIVAESDGTFCYRGILPTAYPIPNDGPAGDFLRVMGYDELTTSLYPSHSPFLGTDPVFATKKSLICQLTEEHDSQSWKRMGFKDGEVKSGRVWVWTYRFVLPTIEEVKQMRQQQQQKAKAKAKL